MLALTRKTGETIRIVDNIRVKIMKIEGQNKVRLAIDAPREIRVMREEISEGEK